ncbi:uncharacterized protein PADG_01344 [Paracoccidioides brasiliensis Pb18]|uniref:Uncharacterized protein n=2 Tax=Paracoccidioides brasiliensis TaxID=121759 RepID=C1G328_PARBD|nr:uncharacterized protein PADG_01344 [Paracoccidioides brasiliensis Pb18]EEH45194.1 hypothetical protein PADG_01344 [Paracoccidioides brasiliensis Pb18]ODH39233.1 hypothetical protein ACO22_01992 [Paracoccidioides brasiliensis]ODH51329.1 hypothetical protein GX48_02569 [Paracoccidioides brasiliensis]
MTGGYLSQAESSNDLPLRVSQRRQASVYDAVAGRVSSSGFRPPLLSRQAHTPSSVPVAPEEALFRRLNAPVRYVENDFYFADERLPADKRLPDSDLLKAIHTYASDFYASATLDQGHTDFLSFDETALIALGILLEEAANESLGDTGDMVFVEGEEITDCEETFPRSGSLSQGRKRVTAGSGSAPSGDETARLRKHRTKRQRRYYSHHSVQSE